MVNSIWKLSSFILLLVTTNIINASPIIDLDKRQEFKQLDLHSHRGGRGEVVETTLQAFAHSLLYQSHTLEFDIGITKDGHPIAWHDEDIHENLCADTAPVEEGDPDFPYVNKYIANLTLAQVKTLDCGKQRNVDFPLQQTYPGAKISTLQEVFDFVQCVDKDGKTKFNIETKLTPTTPNTTVSPEQFIDTLTKVFNEYGVMDQVILQSHDWRTLIISKEVAPELTTSAIIGRSTLFSSETMENSNPETISPWLGGVDVLSFPGTLDQQIAHAAASIKADILSPANSVENNEVGEEGYIPFLNKTMIDTAHELGMKVIAGNHASLTTLEKVVEEGSDGFITDYPQLYSKWYELNGYELGQAYETRKIQECLDRSLKA